MSLIESLSFLIVCSVVIFGWLVDLEELEIHMSAGGGLNPGDADAGQFMSGTGTLTRLSIFFAFRFENLKRLTVQCHSNGGVSPLIYRNTYEYL